MKIVLSGKGGSGKSTITALLAEQYAKLGKRVLVVDTDESNIGLHRLLGMEAPLDLMEYLGGKKKVTKKIMDSLQESSPVRFFQSIFTTQDLPEGYVEEHEGIRLIAIGKIHSFGEGCACPMGVLAKQLLSGLHLQGDEIVLTDTEAGIEHFGRGIEEGADLVLMVLDPSYESVLLTNAISKMSELRSLYYILNKTSPEISARLREGLTYPERIIGEIPLVSSILSAGLDGRPMEDCPSEIKEIIQRIPGLKIVS
jgi:CO dehydrogenase maturation factor